MRKAVILILLVVLVTPLFSQDKVKNPLFAEKGFVVGYGSGIDSLNLPEGRYKVMFLIAHFGIDLFRNRRALKPFPGKCMVFFEPQVNPVWLTGKNENLHVVEFGLNVGFQHVYPLLRNILSSYIFISTGPHFISATTVRQAKGFLFSDNFGAGVYIYPSQNLAVNLGFRLRHMSNADTRAPNQGINTFNYILGISKFIR